MIKGRLGVEDKLENMNVRMEGMVEGLETMRDYHHELREMLINHARGSGDWEKALMEQLLLLAQHYWWERAHHPYRWEENEQLMNGEMEIREGIRVHKATINEN